MALEPPLQPLTGEIIAPKTANRQDEARADIHARGFWGQRHSAFFDVGVFHPNTPSYCNTSVPSLYRRHEAQKKREYGDRVIIIIIIYALQCNIQLQLYMCR